MTDITKFRALDHETREAARTRIDLYGIIDRLNNHIRNPVAYPMSKTQIEASKLLLAKVIPDLKSVERTDAPKRPETREELIAKLAALHARATGGDERRGPDGNAAPERAAEVRH